MEEVSLCLGLLMTLEVGSGTVGVLSSCLSSTLTLEGVREWEIGGGGGDTFMFNNDLGRRE